MVNPPKLNKKESFHHYSSRTHNGRWCVRCAVPGWLPLSPCLKREGTWRGDDAELILEILGPRRLHSHALQRQLIVESEGAAGAATGEAGIEQDVRQLVEGKTMREGHLPPRLLTCYTFTSRIAEDKAAARLQTSQISVVSKSTSPTTSDLATSSYVETHLWFRVCHVLQAISDNMFLMYQM